MGICLSILGPADVRESWLRRLGWTGFWSYCGRQYLASLALTMDSFAEGSGRMKEPVVVSEKLQMS